MTDQTASLQTPGQHPRYLDVRRALADDIVAGRLRPGDRLPVERFVAERFGVSRATVRRAFRQLGEDGLVETLPRRGATVTDRVLGEPPDTLLSFSAMAASRGLAASARVLVHHRRPATIDESEALGIAPGAALFELLRLRMADGVPVSVEHNRIPLARAPGVDAGDYRHASLYETLERMCGVLPARGDVTIEAVAADDEAAGLLDVDAGAPILVVADTLFDTAGRPLSLDRTRYRGDRYRFRTTVRRR